MPSRKRTRIVVVVVCSLFGLGSALVAGVVMADGQPVYQTGPTDDLVEVPVALKDIALGTRVSKADLPEYFVYQRFLRSAVASNVVLTLDELSDRRAVRTIHQGETVRVGDMNKEHVDLPSGAILVSVPVVLEPSDRGFALPGYKVILLATKKSEKRQKQIVVPVLLNVLLVAADTSSSESEQHISFAVTPEQSSLLAEASDDGVTFRIQLPQSGGWAAREDDACVYLTVPNTAEDLRAAFIDR